MKTVSSSIPAFAPRTLGRVIGVSQKKTFANVKMSYKTDQFINNEVSGSPWSVMVKVGI